MGGWLAWNLSKVCPLAVIKYREFPWQSSLKLIPSIPLRTKPRRNLFVLILLGLRGSVLRDFHPRRRRGIPAVLFSLSRITVFIARPRHEAQDRRAKLLSGRLLEGWNALLHGGCGTAT